LPELHGPEKGLAELELFPIKWNHLIDKKILQNNRIERAFRSHPIGIRIKLTKSEENEINQLT